MVSISDRSESARLAARIEDAIELADRRETPRFIGFLDETQQALASAALRSRHCDNYAFYGGHDDAERTLLGVFPENMPPDPAQFPLVSLGFQYRRNAALTHRDFLGALLAAGVKREKIGDILCGSGLAVIMADEEIASFLCDQITRIGREGVRILCPYRGELPAAHTFLESRETVASPRLDSLVKVMGHFSRGKAAEAIRGGQIMVNHLPCENVSRMLAEQDIVSIRGTGRFRLKEMGSTTKKGRIMVTIQQYR